MSPINQFCNLPRNFVGRNSVKLSGKKKFYWLSMQTYLLRMFNISRDAKGKDIVNTTSVLDGVHNGFLKLLLLFKIMGVIVIIGKTGLRVNVTVMWQL